MKTGIELITQERKEQIEKHGWSLDHDASYADGQLIEAALFCYEQARINIGILHHETRQWPSGWIKHFEDKIRAKTVIEQMTVCGAFWLAEFDRTDDKQYRTKALAMGAEIDYYLDRITKTEER